MQYFFEKHIRPTIVNNNFKDICEIGVMKGDNTNRILTIPQVNCYLIDPCWETDLIEVYKNVHRVKVLKGLSLNILTEISFQFDCILIDGDHNWYTVFNELRLINDRNLLRDGGVIFLHDVGWPYGRRDIYYTPDAIPSAFRHPFAKKGIIRDQSELSSKTNFNNHRNNALYEGGENNGVLTAVEDFLKIHGDQYHFSCIQEQHGLGILKRKS